MNVRNNISYLMKIEGQAQGFVFLCYVNLMDKERFLYLVFIFWLSFSLEFLAAVSYEKKNVALRIASIGCFLTSQYPNILRSLRFPSRRWQIFIAHFQLKDESIVLFNHKMDTVVCLRADSLCRHHILQYQGLLQVTWADC